jgi:carbon storage regulator
MPGRTMLVISRRKGQRIAIGDDIEIVITEVHRSTVKVGIRAPRGYTVLRGEVSEAISAANREAASITLERAGELAGAASVAPGVPNAVAVRLGLQRQSLDAASSQPGDATKARVPAGEAATSEAKTPRSSPPVSATPKPGGP